MNPANAYKEIQIKTASQGKLIVMLYDEAIRQLDTAVSLLEKKTKTLDKVNNAILKAQDIISELLVSLDFDNGKEIARNLFNLYLFFTQELMRANMKKDFEPMKRVRKMLADLRDAWSRIANVNPQQNAGGINIAG